MSTKSATNQKQKKPVNKEESKHSGDEWKDKYLRALADYQNLEKRTALEIGKMRLVAAERLITELLPAFDLFELAGEHLHNDGLTLALEELKRILESHGVKSIKPDEKPFDPVQMECVEVTSGSEGVVTEVIAPGYELNGKLIRPAKVKVGNGKQVN